MMKGFLGLMFTCTLFFAYSSGNVEAGIWLGPNLVSNGDFSGGFSGWSNSTDFDLDNGSALIQNGNDRTMNQTVSTESGKRYRVSGNSFAYKASHLAGQGRTAITATGIASTSWWTGKQSESLSYKSSEGIASGASTSIQLKWDVVTYSMGIFFGKFDDVNLQQVIYDPQLDILESDLFVSGDMLDGSLATVGLNFNDLSFADTPTSWNIDWGDGSIDYDPVLNSLHQHVYDMSAGAQIFTATLYGSNQAGEFSESIQIDVVPEPASLMLLSLGGLLLRKRRA